VKPGQDVLERFRAAARTGAVRGARPQHFYEGPYEGWRCERDEESRRTAKDVRFLRTALFGVGRRMVHSSYASFRPIPPGESCTGRRSDHDPNPSVVANPGHNANDHTSAIPGRGQSYTAGALEEEKAGSTPEGWSPRGTLVESGERKCVPRRFRDRKSCSARGRDAWPEGVQRCASAHGERNHLMLTKEEEGRPARHPRARGQLEVSQRIAGPWPPDMRVRPTDDTQDPQAGTQFRAAEMDKGTSTDATRNTRRNFAAELHPAARGAGQKTVAGTTTLF